MPSLEPNDDSDLSDAFGREGIHGDPSHPRDESELLKNQTAPQTRINSPVRQPQQTQDSETSSTSTHKHIYPPSPNLAVEQFPPDQNN
eukprot:scaffold128673_cov29-Attheya_sp.AAC.2